MRGETVVTITIAKSAKPLRLNQRAMLIPEARFAEWHQLASATAGLAHVLGDEPFPTITSDGATTTSPVFHRFGNFRNDHIVSALPSNLSRLPRKRKRTPATSRKPPYNSGCRQAS
jgi:hypothetical protein